MDFALNVINNKYPKLTEEVGHGLKTHENMVVLRFAGRNILKIAYFDCTFGAAGDMLVAACLDAGASLALLEAQLATLPLPENSYKLVKSAVNRCSILACKFDVHLLNDAHGASDDHSEHHHNQDSNHDHAHDHDHIHQSGPAHLPEHDAQRSLTEILTLIENSHLSLAVKQLSSDIFRRLGLAESLVHGLALDQIHFHEVGAIDAIVDIVGFSIAYKELAIEKAFVSAIPLGGGTVKTMHGLFPVPGPAVLNLLKSAAAPVRQFDVQYECLTPTGAAILTTIAAGWGPHPAFAYVNAIGYGAGTINPAGHPNVVRLIVGQSNTNDKREGKDHNNATYRSEVVAVLETNMDDCSPQILAHAMESLIVQGALDVAVVPMTMKKGRSGHKLSVVAKPEDARRLQELILKETTSLGVRSYFCERIILERDFQEITLGDGPAIRIKIGRDLEGQIVNVHPEYEDVVNYSRASNLSLKDVLLQSLNAAATQIKRSKIDE